jgi:hypothetical protein
MSTGSRTNAITPRTGEQLDLFFIKDTGPPSLLTENSVIDTKTITVADATNFIVNDYAGVFCPMANRFFFSDIKSKVGNVITFKTPLDFAFQAGDNAVPFTRNMAVDGSTEKQIFQVRGGGPGSTLKVNITSMVLSIFCSSAVNMNMFGNRPPLENGLVIRRKNGITRNIITLTSNAQIATYDPLAQIFSATHPVQGVDGISANYIFGGDDQHGSIPLLEPGDSMDIWVQDDLSGLLDMRILAKGYEVN